MAAPSGEAPPPLALPQALLPMMLSIVIEKACDDDWPELCYPPVD